MFIIAQVGNTLCCTTKGSNVASHISGTLLNAAMQLITSLTLMIDRLKVLQHLRFEVAILDCGPIYCLAAQPDSCMFRQQHANEISNLYLVSQTSQSAISFHLKEKRFEYLYINGSIKWFRRGQFNP